jgi:EPS-associated MarR family transcriptional regulator
MTDATTLGVLRLLAARPRGSQREIASSLGVSLGKANFCLRALIARGLVKAENFRQSSNRLAYLYLLTPDGIAAKADLTREFLTRKSAEYDALRSEIDELRRECGLVTDAEWALLTRREE